MANKQNNENNYHEVKIGDVIPHHNDSGRYYVTLENNRHENPIAVVANKKAGDLLKQVIQGKIPERVRDYHRKRLRETIKERIDLDKNLGDMRVKIDLDYNHTPQAWIVSKLNKERAIQATVEHGEELGLVLASITMADIPIEATDSVFETIPFKLHNGLEKSDVLKHALQRAIRQANYERAAEIKEQLNDTS